MIASNAALIACSARRRVAEDLHHLREDPCGTAPPILGDDLRDRRLVLALLVVADLGEHVVVVRVLGPPVPDAFRVASNRRSMMPWVPASGGDCVQAHMASLALRGLPNIRPRRKSFSR
jgi:hypothetical protein